MSFDLGGQQGKSHVTVAGTTLPPRLTPCVVLHPDLFTFLGHGRSPIIPFAECTLLSLHPPPF